MKFYNRENELKLLEQLSSSRPGFVVLTGKRRVGKTELLKRFMDKKRALYLFVDAEKSRDILLSEFEALVKSGLGLPDYVRFSTFKELFTFLLKDAGELVVAVDEFQRFRRVEPAVFSELQDLWDRHKDKSGAFFVASGSSMGMIRRIFMENGAPLFKRADNIMTLRPFTMNTVFGVLDDLGIRSPAEKLDLFCLFGGTIYYYRLLERYGAKSFHGALEKLLLNDLAPLRNEVRDTLMEEFGKEHATYFEILSALAVGKGTKKEIGDFTHVEPTSLSPYLYDLMNILQVVDHVVPVMEKPERSKKGRYILSDNFFRFHFAFLYRNASLYEIGAYDRLNEIIQKNWAGFRGKAFEQAASQSLLRALGQEYPEMGKYWDRKGAELDLVGINRKEKKMLVVEIKARKLTVKEARAIIEDLKEKASIVPFQARSVDFGVAAIEVEDAERLSKEGYRIWNLDSLLRMQD